MVTNKVFFNKSYCVFLTLKIVLILANSADPDEMQHYAAFHLCFHRLPRTLLGVPVYKWFRNSIITEPRIFQKIVTVV